MLWEILLRHIFYMCIYIRIYRYMHATPRSYVRTAENQAMRRARAEARKLGSRARFAELAKDGCNARMR